MLSTINPTTLDADTAEHIAAELDAGAFALPNTLRQALQEILTELRAGNEVTVMSSSAVLTTAEAAAAKTVRSFCRPICLRPTKPRAPA